MGLDMYAFKFSADLATSPVDLELPQDREEIAYWRKHPDLHGWMRQLYKTKGGTSEDFNCDTVQITAEDLDQLEKDVSAEALPTTGGFFFGKSYPEDRAGDLRFIATARQAIADGFVVYYWSWW